MAAKFISLLAIYVLHVLSLWALRIYVFEIQVKDTLTTMLLLAAAALLMFLSLSRNWARLSKNHPILSASLRALCLAVSLGCDFLVLIVGWQLSPTSWLYAVLYALARWLLMFVTPYCIESTRRSIASAPLSGYIAIWSVVLGSPVLYALIHIQGFNLQVQSWWLLCLIAAAQDTTRILAFAILDEN